MRNGKYAGLAVLTDLDGTLLTPEKTLSPADAEAIAAFRAEGGLFSFATGRGRQASQPYLDLLKPDFCAVMYNGAMLFDPVTGAVDCPVHLPPETKEILLELTAAFPEIGAEVLRPDGVFVIQLNDVEVNHLAVTNVPLVQKSLGEIDVCDCLKALFAGDTEQITRLREYVQQERFSAVQTAESPRTRAYEREKCFAAVNFTRSHPSFLEILPHGVSKGAALDRVRTALPAGMRICTAGDFDNDIPMLERADFCGCPADAQDRVQETVRQRGGLVSEKTCADGFFAELLSVFCGRS